MKVVCDRCLETVDYKESVRLELVFPWELYGRPDYKGTLCGKCGEQAETELKHFVGIPDDKK